MKKGKKVNKNCNCGWGGSNTGCMFYILGFIGAVWYNISVATGFWVGVLGVLKALVWPIFLIYELFKFLAI